jgi:hypothetical protein
LAWLCSPVRITERLGEQEDVVQKALVKRTPPAASSSRRGVLTARLP